MTKTRKLALSTATIAVLGFSQAFALDVEVKGDRNWLYNKTEPTQLYDNGKPLETATLSNNKVDLKGGHKYKITTNTIENLTLDGTKTTLDTVTGSAEKGITRLNTYKALNITNATLKGKTSLVQAAAYVANTNVPSDIGFTIQNLNLDFSDSSSSLEASANLNAANTTVKGTGTISLLAPGSKANEGTHTANFGTMSLEEGADLTFNISASGSDSTKLTAFSLDTLSVAKNATVKNTKDAKALEISTINLAGESTLDNTNSNITTRTINFDGTTNTGTKIEGILKSHTDGTTLNFASGASMQFTGQLSASAGSTMSFGGTGFGNLAAAKDTNINISGGKITGDSLSLSAGANLTVSNNALANIKTLTTGANSNSIIEINEAVLNLGSDFKLEGSTLNFVQNSADSISPALNVDGKASISSGATVAVVVAPGLNETKQTSYTLINATSVSADAGATGVVKVRRSLNDVKTAAAQYGIDIDTSNAENADKTVDAELKTKTFTLSESGNSIVLSGDSPIIDASTLQTAQADQLNALNAALEALKSDTGVGLNAAGKTQVNAAAAAAKAQAAEAATKTNAQIAQEMTAGVAVDGANEILNSAYGSAANAFSGTDSETKKAVYNDIAYNGGRGLVKDISDGLGSNSNLASSTASIINNINLSNTMAVSGRVAAARNPFGNVAQGYVGGYYADLESDMPLPLYYANDGYNNGFWGDFIGGINSIDGENGALYGLTLGYDKQFESTLLGFYASYVVGSLNDKVIEQDSHNIQVGVYGSFNQRDIEVNFKVYGQVSPTDLTATRGAGEAEASFNRLYAGVSANVGKIFSFNENKTFLMPFIGENYYYAHTPAYDESGFSALSVSSTNNHALSFDVGVDFRQYLGENSFIYVIPSIERYVVNTGTDYTAGFLGSDVTFSVAGKSKTKTYGQALLGGNINVSEKFNVNLSLGVKQILGGKVDEKNETYLTGNLGFKYKF